jgi:hypothetical protein
MSELKQTSRKTYSTWIRRLLAVSQRSDRHSVTLTDVEQFFLKLADTYQNSPKTCRVAYYAIRRHYTKCLPEMPEAFQRGFEQILRACKPQSSRSLPLPDTALIRPEEAEAWLQAIANPILQSMAWLCYNPGLMAQAICELPPESGKYLPIPEHLQSFWGEHLRTVKREKSRRLFPYTVHSLYKALNAGKHAAGFLQSGAGVRLLRTVGIIRLLREDGRDPNQVMREAGILTRQAFLPYLKLAGRI